jgi:hypothetical protein
VDANNDDFQGPITNVRSCALITQAKLEAINESKIAALAKLHAKQKASPKEHCDAVLKK